MDASVHMQIGEVLKILTNGVNLDFLNGEALKLIRNNPEEASKNFTEFLKNGANIVKAESRLIQINRSLLFNPKTLFNRKVWSSREDEVRTVALTKIDLNEIVLVSTLKKGETRISHEEDLKRLKRKNNLIRLDAGILMTLLENQNLIPEKWKEETNGEITFILFNGTFLRKCKNNFILYLYWSSFDKKWNWGYNAFYSDCCHNTLSAVLEVK
ncbi:MAG: hypothetical protein NTU81_00285 [Candidatus Nomurabacteria bacterium]|nr:hypothetical protein [Candidatus Nomurabacteria bacterium]